MTMCGTARSPGYRNKQAPVHGRFPPHPPPLTRRSALLGTVGLLALPTSTLGAAPASSGVWPNALQVPGGIAWLPLGPAATRPVAHMGDVPLLVLGDVIEWTALVGMALSATPGEASITVQTPEGGQRQLAYMVSPNATPSSA